MDTETTPRIRFDLLAKLADILDGVLDDKFNYACWVGAGFNGAAIAAECGTTACALGWATMIPELGLELRLFGGRLGNMPGVCRADADLSDSDHPHDVSVNSAMEVFGLSRDQVLWLFTPSDEDFYDGYDVWLFTPSDEDFYDGYDVDDWGRDGKPKEFAGPKTVARHIRNFIADGGTPS